MQERKAIPPLANWLPFSLAEVFAKQPDKGIRVELAER
jgi:hypothetical protein